jgi:hypothetical protein
LDKRLPRVSIHYMDCSCHNNTRPGAGAKFGLKSPVSPRQNTFVPHKILRCDLNRRPFRQIWPRGATGRVGLTFLQWRSSEGRAVGVEPAEQDRASFGGTAPQGGWRQLGSGWCVPDLSSPGSVHPVSSQPRARLFGQCADRSVQGDVFEPGDLSQQLRLTAAERWLPVSLAQGQQRPTTSVQQQTRRERRKLTATAMRSGY